MIKLSMVPWPPQIWLSPADKSISGKSTKEDGASTREERSEKEGHTPMDYVSFRMLQTSVATRVWNNTQMKMTRGSRDSAKRTCSCIELLLSSAFIGTTEVAGDS